MTDVIENIKTGASALRIRLCGRETDVRVGAAEGRCLVVRSPACRFIVKDSVGCDEACVVLLLLSWFDISCELPLDAIFGARNGHF